MERGIFQPGVSCRLTETSVNSELRILILEDNEDDAKSIEHELRTGGINFRSIRADTRDSFVEGMRGCPPDLILATHSLPSFDGLAALEIARESNPEVPFIFVTGAMGEKIAVEALKRGATDFVLKSRLWRLVPSINRALCEAREL